MKSLSGHFLKALEDVRESNRQYLMTQRIHGFFRAAQKGDAAQVQKFLDAGIDTKNYKDCPFGNHGTKDWLLHGMMEAIEHGRPSVVPLLATRFKDDMLAGVKAVGDDMFGAEALNLLTSMRGLAATAQARGMQLATTLSMNALIAAWPAGHDAVKPKRDNTDISKELLDGRKPDQLIADFSEVSKQLGDITAVMGSALLAEEVKRKAAAEERRRIEHESNLAKAQALEAERKAHIAAIPQKATRLSRGIKPVKTVKFRGPAA